MSKRQFDEDGYPCDSTPIDWESHGEAWFYTQKDGLLICADGCKHCGRQRRSLTLPWRSIKRALADREKAKERRHVVVHTNDRGRQ